MMCVDAGREKVHVKAASPICCALCSTEAGGRKAGAFGFMPFVGESSRAVFRARSAEMARRAPSQWEWRMGHGHGPMHGPLARAAAPFNQG